MANAGPLKWLLFDNGDLVAGPYRVGPGGKFEISHAVYAEGRTAIAGGQADIAIIGNNVIGNGLSNYTGHFGTSPASLRLGEIAFAQQGVRFNGLVTNPNLPR